MDSAPKAELQCRYWVCFALMFTLALTLAVTLTLALSLTLAVTLTLALSRTRERGENQSPFPNSLTC